MAKKTIENNECGNRGGMHQRVHGFGHLLLAGILVSLAVFMAACGPTASSNTSSQSADVPAEEQATQDDEKPDAQAEPEAVASDGAEESSAEEPAQRQTDAQRKHLESLCWVTMGDHSYHENSACPELGGSTDLIEMTVGAAIDAGYDPCYYCAG